VCKIWTKNSQPFGKKCQKTSGGIFFGLTHCSDRGSTLTAVADWFVDLLLQQWVTLPLHGQLSVCGCVRSNHGDAAEHS